jgi:hypothetical protein
MGKEKQIRESIQKIANAGSRSSHFLNAEIVSVDSETCTVKRNGLELSDVRLSAVVNGNTKNLVIKPKVGSLVLIADLSGQMRDLVIIGWSEVDTITINGGELGGLIKIQDLTDKLNALKDQLNSVVTKFNTHTHNVSTTGTAAAQAGVAAATTGQAQQATAFNKSDYEDEKIKH